MLALVPLPNQSGDTDNYFNSGTQRLNRNNVDAKVNWNRNERHQLWFKYSAMDALVHGDFSLGEAGGDCLCDGGIGDGDTLVQIAGIGQTYTVVADVPDRRHVRLDALRPGRAAARSRHRTSARTCSAFPARTVPTRARAACRRSTSSGFSPLGNPEGWSPLYRNDQSYTFNTNASWIKGAHDIRFGFDFVHHLMNHWQPELGEGPRGAFHFDPGVTALEPRSARRARSASWATRRRSRTTGTRSPAFLLGTPDVPRARAASSSR